MVAVPAGLLNILNSLSPSIRRNNLQMELAMLKDCWNNPQTWGFLFPTWSHQDGTKSLPSLLHPLSPIHQPPSFPKISHHNSPPSLTLFFRAPYSFLKSYLALVLIVFLVHWNHLCTVAFPETLLEQSTISRNIFCLSLSFQQYN